MHNPTLALLASALLVAPAALAQQPRPAKAIPAFPKAPKLEGEIAKEYKKALSLPKVDKGTAAFTAHLGYFKTTLYLALEVEDDVVDAGDALEVMLQFPEAGTTAEGYRYRFAFDGKRTAEGEFAAPMWAQDRVTAAVGKAAKGVTFEIALPAEALPRFPAFEPMTFDLCVTYEDRDAVGSQANTFSNCSGASMGKEAVKLPDDFRKKLALKPPEQVVGLQRRQFGWIGYGIMHYPTWAYGDASITPTNLPPLVTDEPADAASAGVNLPSEFLVEKARILSVLSGKNPYAEPGKCNSDQELRIALYLVKGRTVDRVLEWPGANCMLGRATSVVVEDDGTLVIGYSNGTTSQFAWTGSKFERTEIGKR